MPVPVENVLGGEAGIGNGTAVFNQMMIPERMISAGGALGVGRAAIEIAARYADRRRAFWAEDPTIPSRQFQDRREHHPFGCGAP